MHLHSNGIRVLTDAIMKVRKKAYFTGFLAAFFLSSHVAFASEISLEFPADSVVGQEASVRTFGYSDPGPPPLDQVITRVLGRAGPDMICPANPLTSSLGASITNGVVPAGAFSLNGVFTPSEPGDYVVCTWLLYENAPYVGPLAALVTVRSPVFTLQTSGSMPSKVKTDTAFKVNFTFQAEQPRTLFLRHGLGKSCPATVAAADAQFAKGKTGTRGAQNIPINASGSFTYSTKVKKPGRYVVCGYIQAQATDAAALASVPAVQILAVEKKKKRKKR